MREENGKFWLEYQMARTIPFWAIFLEIILSWLGKLQKIWTMIWSYAIFLLF